MPSNGHSENLDLDSIRAIHISSHCSQLMWTVVTYPVFCCQISWGLLAEVERRMPLIIIIMQADLQVSTSEYSTPIPGELGHGIFSIWTGDTPCWCKLHASILPIGFTCPGKTEIRVELTQF